MSFTHSPKSSNEDVFYDATSDPTTARETSYPEIVPAKRQNEGNFTPNPGTTSGSVSSSMSSLDEVRTPDVKKNGDDTDSKGGKSPFSFLRKIRNRVTSKLGKESTTDSSSIFSDTTEIRVKVKGKNKKLFNRLVAVQELLSDSGVHGSKESINSSTKSSRRNSVILNQNVKQVQGNALSPSSQKQASANPSNAGTGKFNGQNAQGHLTSNSTGTSSAIWALKFNRDGRFLASGGQDCVLRIWCLVSESTDDNQSKRNSLSMGSNPSLYSNPSPLSNTNFPPLVDDSSFMSRSAPPIFQNRPYREYIGHSADILEFSWSKNDFLLSSSMDKTVRLWHPLRKECLCCFQHMDFVTSVSFHPKDDRFFLSGCLDGRIRLWNIPNKKLAAWNELPDPNGLITAISFNSDGKVVIVGSYVGSCYFYETDGLKYNTQIQVRSTRGKNSRGEKISGIEIMPNQAPGDEKILITSNDSRIRIYNLRDKQIFCKFKGFTNASSQIKGTFSDNSRFVIAGSEDKNVYIWDLLDDSSDTLFSLQEGSREGKNYNSPDLVNTGVFSPRVSRRDHQDRYESFQSSRNQVTCAIFAPKKLSQLLENAGYRTKTVISPPNQLDVPKVSKIVRAKEFIKYNSFSARSSSDNQGGTMGSVSSGNSSSASMAVIHPIHNPAEGAIIVTADTSGILRVYENLHSDPLYYFSPGSRLSVSIAIPANEVQLPSAIPISPSSNAHIISVSKISSRSLPPDNSNVVLTDTKPKSTISSNSTNGKVQQDHTTSVNMYATASRKSIRSPPDSEAKPANSVNNINRKSETS